MATVIAGLALANHHLSSREPPLIRISDITPLMNFSSVRIKGRQESAAIRLQNGSMMYLIDDGTGTLAVFADPPSDGIPPKVGSLLTVVGNLSIGVGNNIRLRARVGEQVVPVHEPDSVAVKAGFKLNDIIPEQAGKRMTVYGRVSKIWNPRQNSRAPTKIVLQDESGSLNVVHWLKESPDIQVGDALEVTGMVNLYDGRLQLKLRNTADVQPYLKNRD